MAAAGRGCRARSPLAGEAVEHVAERQVGCLIPEQELLSMVPGQPPLSRWIAQMEISGSPWDRAKLAIARASGR